MRGKDRPRRQRIHSRTTAQRVEPSPQILCLVLIIQGEDAKTSQPTKEGLGAAGASSTDITRATSSSTNLNAAPTSASSTTSSAAAAGGGGVRNHGLVAAASLAEIPYHYDALSVFRAKDPRFKEAIPDSKVRGTWWPSVYRTFRTCPPGLN